MALLLPFALLAPSVAAQNRTIPLSAERAIPIVLGTSVVPLNGPWKFHVGDDPRWAAPEFDDSGWETIDLTPAEGAHDSDVGLTGYVPGWTAKGHAGYSGYAWYRITVSVSAMQRTRLALTGPPDVDDAYQVFFDGRLLGSDGDFSARTPTAYSIQPRMFSLPKSAGALSAANAGVDVLAFRVWMGAWSVNESPDAGGIHIAPAIGEKTAIDARYRLQWLETVRGYIVDAVEPILFALLAMMACTLIAFDRSDPAYIWLSAALLLTALVRANQVLFFWTQSESIQMFDVTRNGLLVPLGLGAWLIAWRAWFKLGHPGRIPKVIGGLVLLYTVAQLLSLATCPSVVPHAVYTMFHTLSVYMRLAFVLLLGRIVYSGVRHRGREGWLAMPAVVLISIGLFAQELSALHVPGIWFPYGTGVSRTQFAYAAFAVALFVLLLHRLRFFARHSSGVASTSQSSDLQAEARK